jgi:hypothetical protein
MPWYKGNLHTHSTNSNDGLCTPQQLCDWYQAHGYDFLAITDHDHITGPADVPSPRGLLIIPGEEVSGNHLVTLNVSCLIDKRLPIQSKIDLALAQGGYCIAAHPNWQNDHWSLPLLQSTTGYVAMEIFNTHVTELEGSAYALDKWDRLLTDGRCVWGSASDDVHDLATGGAGEGWIVVRAAELTVPAILHAVARGEFYASTGVELQEWSVADNTVRVAARDAREIVFVGAGGRALKTVNGTSAVYTAQGHERYVRAECRGIKGAAYTQPIFVSG